MGVVDDGGAAPASYAVPAVGIEVRYDVAQIGRMKQANTRRRKHAFTG